MDDFTKNREAVVKINRTLSAQAKLAEQNLNMYKEKNKELEQKIKEVSLELESAHLKISGQNELILEGMSRE